MLHLAEAPAMARLCCGLHLRRSGKLAGRQPALTWQAGLALLLSQTLNPTVSPQASVREVKRLDSISRSPVYSSLGEALAGLPTIRAYRAEERLAKRNAALVDTSVVMSLVNMSMNRRASRS